jgi:hypothetical protein
MTPVVELFSSWNRRILELEQRVQQRETVSLKRRREEKRLSVW